MKKVTKIGWALGAGLFLVLAGLIAFAAAFGAYRIERSRNEDLTWRKAQSALDQHDFDTAIALYSQILQRNLPPAKASAAYCGRAQAENQRFKYDDAIRDFSEAIRRGSMDVSAYWGRGYSYQCKAELDKALSDYAEVLRRDRNAGQVYFNRGLIYLQRKEWARAAQDFSESIRCEPELSYAYLDRGTALAQLNDLDGALVSFDAAISLNPKLADAYLARATVYRRRNNEDRARADEIKVAQLTPPKEVSAPRAPGQAPDASGIDFVERARIAEMAHHHDETIDLCTKALDARLTPFYVSGALTMRGNAYAGKGDLDHALRDYDEAIRVDPQNVLAWNNRGNVYARKNQRDKSTRDYSEAIRLNPNLEQAYCNRAIDYMAAGNMNKALADLTEAIRINPKFAEAYSRRSVALMQLKRGNEALADAQTAVTLRPESSEAYLFRGRLRLARHEFAEARADFERTFQLVREPDRDVLNEVAWFYATCPDASGRDGKRAIELATKACELSQWKDAHILDTLAAAYAEAGDFNQATKWQSQASNPPDPLAKIRSEMRQRLDLYRKHRPYRAEAKP
jgi:tetratricopeptide (TPR) repeat protein